MRAIQITEFGGPEVLNLVELLEPKPEPGQLLIDVSRAGVNYADTHNADNSYLASTSLPFIPGGEVVGTAADGGRVVALLAGGGGYAQRAVAPEDWAFEVPERSLRSEPFNTAPSPRDEAAGFAITELAR